tara:strand:- start:89 stop:238 length:150 start_codon:yes stop_codon:yes gene_type:complete
MASPGKDRVTLCGHKTTLQEFQRIKLAKPEEINCRRCLKLYEARKKETE